jgi:hypothetical protein
MNNINTLHWSIFCIHWENHNNDGLWQCLSKLYVKQLNIILSILIIHQCNSLDWFTLCFAIKYIGSTLPSSPLNIISPITMWWEEIFYQTWRFVSRWYYIGHDLNCFSNTIVAWFFVFKFDIIYVCNYKSRHKTY